MGNAYVCTMLLYMARPICINEGSKRVIPRNDLHLGGQTRVPRHRRSTLGRRAFSVAGPMAWNALPDDLRDPSLSADNFTKTLKTHLFRNALGH